MIITSVLFFVIAFFFGFYGFRICLKLSDVFPEFYGQNKVKLVVATVGLSLSTGLRGIFDLIRVVNPDFNQFIISKSGPVDFLVLIFLDFIPLCFQFCSMVFGYIKQEEKFRDLKSSNAVENNDTLFADISNK
jgi:hypothetical protein